MTTNPRVSRERASRAVSKLPARASRDARQEAVVETIRLTGLTPRSAALSCGVSPSVFYVWMDDGASGFRDRVAVAERQFERSMASVVAVAAVKTKSWRAAIAFLERRFPELWVARQRVDLSVEDRTLEDEMAETMTEEEIDERMQQIIERAMRRAEAKRRQGAES